MIFLAIPHHLRYSVESKKFIEENNIMLEILTRAGCFIGIILLGYFLKKIGFFKEEDFKV